MKVLDLQGAERDAEWLRQKYGAVLVESNDAGADGRRFVLEAVQVTTGVTICLHQVHDEWGGPLPNHATAFSWADGPVDLSTAQAAVFQTRYRPRAAVQFTNQNGDTAYGIGMGSYITDLAAGGPHACWVLHDRYPSDVLDRVGMLAGTNHDGALRLTWALRAASQTVADVPTALREFAWQKLGRPLNPTAAFQRHARLHNLGVPLTDEKDVTLNGTQYRMQGYAGGIVFAAIGDWGNVQALPW